MAEDSNNPLAGFFNALQEKKGAKGVVKPGKVRANLTPEESARYKNIFKIMKDVVDPDPEAASVDSTKQAKVGQTAQIQAAAGGDGGGGGNMITGGLLALGVAAGLLAGYLKDLKERFEKMFEDGRQKAEGVEYAVRGLASLRGIFGMISMVGKLLQPLVKGFNLLKNSKAFKAIGGAAGKVIKVGSKIGKAAGSLFKMIGKIGKTIGKRLKFIPFLGSIFNFMTAYEEFQRGNYLRAGLELLAGVLNLVPGLGNLAGSAINGILLIYDIMSSSEQGKDLRNMLGNPGEKIKEFVAPLVDKIVGFFKGVVEWIADAAGAFKDLVIKGLKMFLPDSFFDNEEDVKGNEEYKRKEAQRKADQRAMSVALAAARERVGAEEFRRMMIPPKELHGRSADDPELMAFNKRKNAWIQSQMEISGDINDGVVMQNGRATRIDSKDSLIAAKAGGPIDKMLDQNSAIQSQQLNVLKEIRDGIRALQSSGSSFANTSLTTEFFA